MPTHPDTTSGITAADVDSKLRAGYFVKRGDIMKAFGLSKSDMDALVPEIFKPAPFPKTKTAAARYKTNRARFVRSQVMAVAKSWERSPA